MHTKMQTHHHCMHNRYSWSKKTFFWLGISKDNTGTFTTYEVLRTTRTISTEAEDPSPCTPKSQSEYMGKAGFRVRRDFSVRRHITDFLLRQEILATGLYFCSATESIPTSSHFLSGNWRLVVLPISMKSALRVMDHWSDSVQGNTQCSKQV